MPLAPLAPLPIDDVLPALLAALRAGPNAVLVAPPGAGKTTRVPAAILDAGLAGDGEVVVLQPRRLAARMAAQRVATERGVNVGGEVGYEVRFDRSVGAATRIRFVTEGVLTRQLLADPMLRRAGCVIIDEFHERHLAGDLALALLRRLQRAHRPELRLVVMSATFDPAPVAAFLAAPVLRSEGRAFPVDIEYLPPPAGAAADWPLGKQVSSAVRTLIAGGLDGDILVFLPGAAEIRRTAEDCAAVAAQADLAILPLHGDLPAAEQDRAVARADRRKLVLATNVAETSITIDGVVAVIDSGLARIARHSPWSGIAALQVEPVSRASATQRAGRAGRTRPGRCLRLYSRHDHDTRRELEVPEVARADLAEVALELHAAGEPSLADFPWYEAPASAALAAADELLRRLGAVDERGAVTATGRRMLRFPAHPRQARLLVEAEARGVAGQGAILAALIGQRSLRAGQRSGGLGGGPRTATVSGPSDLLADLDLMLEARADGLRPDRLRRAGLDVNAALAADRAARQLERLCDGRGGAGGDGRGATAGDGRGGRRGGSPGSSERGGNARPPADAAAEEEALSIAILSGYPDRVGRRRAPRSPEVVLSGGGAATLDPASVVLDAELLVAVDVDERGRGGARGAIIRRASRIDPAWLLDHHLDRVRDSDGLEWNPAQRRVERVLRMSYDGLVIDEQRDLEGARRPESRAEAAAILAREAVAAGLARLLDPDALAALRARAAFAAAAAPAAGIPLLDDTTIAAAIAAAADGLISLDELRRAPLQQALEAHFAPHRAVLDRLAPSHVTLANRRRVAVHYEPDKPPWIASRMQDFFGLARAPSIADGRVALVLHLLAPNQRPVQVTTDLPGFWVRHYPALRKELMRRYPRHAWPEDPLTLVAE